jgi:hypothetical protein
MLKFLITILIVALPFTAYGITATVTGSEVTVKYDEPTTNVDGSALVDLEYTSISADIGSGFVWIMNVVATAPTGGGSITQKVMIPPVTEGLIGVEALDEVPNRSPMVTVPYDALPPAGVN